MDYPPDLVLEVNRVYHDCEQAEYDNKHPEILKEEVKRWQSLATNFIRSPEPQNILDLGSGTGFVPLQVAPLLTPEDSLTCSDISPGMLKVCRSIFRGDRFNCSMDYLQLDGKTIEAKTDSFDCITMNSVLHHLPDFAFLEEIARVVKPGGRIIICHEHNRAFYTNPFLVANFFLFMVLLHPEKIINKLTGGSKKKFNPEAELYDQVNRILIDQGTVSEPMPESQIVEIVDIHSPFAGGRFHVERGIDITQLQKDHLPGSQLEYFVTYNHLEMLTNRNSLTRAWSTILSRLWPKSGSSFAAVVRLPD